MEEQRTRSRAGPAADVEAAEFAREAGFETEFVGYEKTDADATRRSAAAGGRGLPREAARVAFYPDGGGQVTDQGYIENEETGARAASTRPTGSATTRCSSAGDGFPTGDQPAVPWSARFDYG